jgi:hypothetical protein
MQIRCLLGLTILWFVFPYGQDVDAAQPKFEQEFLRSKCFECHEGRDSAGGLDLSVLSPDLTNPESLRHWVRVIDRVREGEMPPRDAGEIGLTDRDAFVSTMSEWVKQHQLERYTKVGRVPLRRLTHAQVERTLHDLLATHIPLASLVPPDPRIDGYTSIADGQPMSHFQLQSHLSMVDAALDAAFARASTDHQHPTRRLSVQEIARKDPKQRCREPEIIDDVAVTWSGNVTFYGRIPATEASEDGWYEFTIAASSLNAPKGRGVWCTVRSGECVSSAPLMSWLGAFEAHQEQSTYTFRGWLPAGHMLEIRPGDETLKQARFQGGQVGTGEGESQDVPGVAFHWIEMKRIYPGGSQEDVRQRLFGECENEFTDSKVDFATNEVKQRVTTQIHKFAKEAFRRPIELDVVQAYVELFFNAISQGEAHLAALQATYRAILSSPRCLYFRELPGALDSHAVADRMSYFLTGSAPDPTLRELADTDQLRSRDRVAEQVERLLDTDKGRTMMDLFANEWLDLCDIDFTQPDRKLYPHFDQIVLQSMLAESQCFLRDLLDQNASVASFIHSQHTYANSRLARYYELQQDVDADSMIRVALNRKDLRGGLLTQGAILKVTANGTNTSPVLRGVWIARRLLGIKIPPPPAGVPAIEPDTRGATTIREQLALHRQDATCASCHEKIDPIGFALENYDPAGGFRKTYPNGSKKSSDSQLKVDASYQLPDGQAFENAAEFQELLLTDLKPIARNFVEHLLAYGTGAAPSFADREVIEEIVNQCAGDDYGIRSLLIATVTSPIFLSK